MDRQDQIRKELIEKKLHDGIIKLSSRFDFDMDSIKVDSVLGVITIKNNPVYIRLLSSCHGGWDARLYANSMLYSGRHYHCNSCYIRCKEALRTSIKVLIYRINKEIYKFRPILRTA